MCCASHNGGGQEIARALQRLAATHQNFGAFGQGIGHMLLHFGDCVGVDQRPQVGAGLQPVAHFHLCHPRRQFFGKRVINARLHIDAVGADAGLAVVAELAHDRAFYGCVQIGIVKHDKGRIAAQLHAAFHHLIGRLAQQDAPHLGGSGKGQLAHGGVFAKLLANRAGTRRGDDAKHTLRDARAFGQNAHHQRRKRRFGGGAAYECAARGQRRACLAGDHGVGKVPWRDAGCHADGLFEHHNTLVALMAWNGFAIDALGLFGKKFDERGTIGNLTLGLGQRFALFGGQNRAQIVLVGHHQVKPAAQHGGALFAGPLRPFFLGGFCLGNGIGHLGAAEIGDIGNHIAPGWVGHGKGGPTFALHPFAGAIG